MSAAPLSFLITGATSGIGYETANTLAAAGHAVIITARTQHKLDTTINNIKSSHPSQYLNITGYTLDLIDFPSIESLASNIISTSINLHCLICNAGANLNGTAHGVHKLWVNNYLGHYHLTRLLLPVLQSTAKKSNTPSRVIQVSSVMHRRSSAKQLFLDADSATPQGHPYQHSKLAQVIFAFELHRRYSSSVDGKVISIAVNPGGVLTQVWRYIPPPLSYLAHACFKLILLTPLQGSMTSSYAAVCKEWTENELIYLTPYGWCDGWCDDDWSNGWILFLLDLWHWDVKVMKCRANKDAYNEEAGKRLWELSEEQCKRIIGKTDLYKEE